MFPSTNNQLPLLDQLTPRGLSHAATAFVEALKTKSIAEVVRRRRQVVLKRRNSYGEQMADLANLYFRLAQMPIRYISDLQEWRRREIRCFRMLNGDCFSAFAPTPRAVCLDRLP